MLTGRAVLFGSIFNMGRYRSCWIGNPSQQSPLTDKATSTYPFTNNINLLAESANQSPACPFLNIQSTKVHCTRPAHLHPGHFQHHHATCHHALDQGKSKARRGTRQHGLSHHRSPRDGQPFPTRSLAAGEGVLSLFSPARALVNIANDLLLPTQCLYTPSRQSELAHFTFLPSLPTLFPFLPVSISRARASCYCEYCYFCLSLSTKQSITVVSVSLPTPSLRASHLLSTIDLRLIMLDEIF